MAPGLFVALDREEEVALRRVAYGVSKPRQHFTPDITRLQTLDLVDRLRRGIAAYGAGASVDLPVRGPPHGQWDFRAHRRIVSKTAGKFRGASPSSTQAHQAVGQGQGVDPRRPGRTPPATTAPWPRISIYRRGRHHHSRQGDARTTEIAGRSTGLPERAFRRRPAGAPAGSRRGRRWPHPVSLSPTMGGSPRSGEGRAAGRPRQGAARYPEGRPAPPCPAGRQPGLCHAAVVHLVDDHRAACRRRELCARTRHAGRHDLAQIQHPDRWQEAQPQVSRQGQQARQPRGRQPAAGDGPGSTCSPCPAGACFSTARKTAPCARCAPAT